MKHELTPSEYSILAEKVHSLLKELNGLELISDEFSNKMFQVWRSIIVAKEELEQKLQVLT